LNSRTMSLARRLALLAVALPSGTSGLAGCGEPPVTLKLVAAEDLTVPPEFVRLVFRPRDVEPIETEIFSMLAPPQNAFAEVAPGVVFSVDAIGCTDNQREACEGEGSFNARGCTGGLVRGRNDPLEIVIELHGAVQGNALCPVEAPET
jgi:hypothetical protein